MAHGVLDSVFLLILLFTNRPQNSQMTLSYMVSLFCFNFPILCPVCSFNLLAVLQPVCLYNKNSPFQ